MRLQDHAIARTDLLTLPLDLLDVDPAFNVRLPCDALTEHIRDLADGIKASGFRRDRALLVRVQGDRAVVVDGHCRLAAVKIAVAEGAEIKGVPCTQEPKGTSEADRTLSLMTANSGRSLQPLEEAAAVMRLISFGWSEAEIARKRGKSRQWVNNLLTLNAAPEPIRQAVINGEVSATQATKLTREGPLLAVEKLNKARAASPGRRVTEATVRQSQPRVLTAAQTCINALIDAWDQIDPRGTPVPVQDAIERLRAHYTNV